jgi:Arc/MetJ-type ribon-helix-helix transcriptional regulator
MNTRIGIRISKDTREKIDNLVAEGKAESISDFVKKAIDASLGN